MRDIYQGIQQSPGLISPLYMLQRNELPDWGELSEMRNCLGEQSRFSKTCPFRFETHLFFTGSEAIVHI